MLVKVYSDGIEHVFEFINNLPAEVLQLKLFIKQQTGVPGKIPEPVRLS